MKIRHELDGLRQLPAKVDNLATRINATDAMVHEIKDLVKGMYV